MHNILITTSTFGKYDNQPILMLKRNGFNPILNPYGKKMTTEEVQDLIIKYNPVGIIAGVEPLNRTTLKDASRLKVISRCGIGTDNIDFEFTNQMSIKVMITDDGPTVAVAELALGLILALLRHLHNADKYIRSGLWKRPMGSLLNKKTIGVVGCGKIGKHLMKLLKGFDCDVLGVDPVAEENGLYKKVDLMSALRHSDIITLHIPYNSENHHYIDADKLAMLKPSALLINTSRGGLIDEEALYDALTNKRLKGAAIDCFETEPYHGPLINLENVILSSHIGSYALECRIAMEIRSVDNLLKQIQSD